jgi:predicted outer membrane lipoprotein
MLNLSVSPSNYGLSLALAWLLIGVLLNAKAFYVLTSLALYWVIQNATDRNFSAFIICSSLYFLSSYQGFIRIPLGLRFAFTCFGVVYFVGSVDQFMSYHFNIDTEFDRIQPYFVTVINAFVLAYLLGDWRRGNGVGFAHYCADWIRWYKMHSSHNRQLAKEKE